MAVHVSVHGGNGEKAIRDLKKKMQRELIPRQMKLGRFYESPSEERVRRRKESDRRIRKNRHRKRLEGQ
ncbi:MAG: 30S ribosomal protein S21 [Rickettsiales bacterium]|nr:MAG: 30S ribosomal protein S21 [Rickettsiales bacterium]